MKYLTSFLVSIGLFFMYLFTMSFFTEFTNYEVASTVGCAVFGLILIVYYRKSLKEELKNIKFDKKALVFAFILTALSIIIHEVILFILKEDAANNAAVFDSFKKMPLVYGSYVLLFGPITEELIFRYPYKKINNKISFVIYSTLFALIHLISSTSIIGLTYILVYMPVSLSIGIHFYKNDNIFTSIAYHIFNNLINIVILLI